MPARKSVAVSLVRMSVGKSVHNLRRNVSVQQLGARGERISGQGTFIRGNTEAERRADLEDQIQRYKGNKVIVTYEATGKTVTYGRQDDGSFAPVSPRGGSMKSADSAGSRRATHIAAEEGNKERAMAKKKITSVRIHIGAAKDGVRSVSVRRGSKTVTGSLEGSAAAQKKGLQRLIRAWCRTGVQVVMTVEGSKEVCTYTKEGARYVCTKSTKKRIGTKVTVRRKAKSTKAKTSTAAEAAPKARKARKTRKTRKTGTRKVSAYNKFVAAQMKAGKSMKEAAAAWRAQSGTTAKKTVKKTSKSKTAKPKTAKPKAAAKPKTAKPKTAKPKATKAKTSKAKATKPKASKAKSGTRKVSAYNKFVAAQRKAGKTMAQAAAAWRAHKGETAKTEVVKKTTKGKSTKGKSTKASKAKAAKTTKAKSTKAKTTKGKSSAALPAVGDVVAAAALRTARRKHGAAKKRAAPKRRTVKRAAPKRRAAKR